MVVVFGAILVFAYGTVALLSQDPLWFRGGVEMSNPERVIIRVDGTEYVLTSGEADYGPIVAAARESLSGFKAWALGSMGLSEETKAQYQHEGVIVEFYFTDPLDFHLPFPDGSPTALLFPVEGRHGGEGYVFRGKNGRWWAGQLTMSDPQPLYDALTTLGYTP